MLPPHFFLTALPDSGLLAYVWSGGGGGGGGGGGLSSILLFVTFSRFVGSCNTAK